VVWSYDFRVQVVYSSDVPVIYLYFYLISSAVQVMLLLFSSSDVIMWSQGSSAVLKSCSCNLFQFFLNFQVLFKWCSCYFLQLQWSCDLRVQVMCSSHVPRIFFNVSLIFRCCYSYVLALFLKWCGHVISGFEGLIFLLFFCYLHAHAMLIKFAF